MTKDNDDALRRELEHFEKIGYFLISDEEIAAHLRRLVAENEREREARIKAQEQVADLQARIARADVERQRAVAAKDALLRQAVEALELGRDALDDLARAAESIRKYRPKVVEAMDAEVRQAGDAIAAIRQHLEGKA